MKRIKYKVVIDEGFIYSVSEKPDLAKKWNRFTSFPEDCLVPCIINIRTDRITAILEFEEEVLL